MIAVPVASSTADPVGRALRRARDYLLGKQSPGGGFCFYRGYYLEEPNLADTWHGVAALTALLDVALAKADEHAGFVIGRAIEPQPFALYCRTRSLLALDTPDPSLAEVERAVAAVRVWMSDPTRPQFSGAAVQRLGQLLWLRKHFGLESPLGEIANALLALANRDGGYGTPSNLLETGAAIAVLALCGAAPDPATAGFVQSMADPQFGFRLTGAARFPHLETVHAGVASCRRLGLHIPHAAAARDFVLSCQTGDGGFARTADALPDLALTHLALTTLVRDLGTAASAGTVGKPLRRSEP